jgi:LysM repeat protein
MQKLRSSIVLMMIAIAIILATGVFLAINVVQNRNNEAETQSVANTFPVVVGAEQILLQVDPNLRPTIIDTQVTDAPRVEDAPDQQVEAATATPEPTAVPSVEQATAVPPAIVEKIIYQDYTVQPGDTLYSISQRIDTSIALMADKGLSQTSLTPGQIIKLPIGNPAYCTGKGRPYAVGEGDTAFNISQRFNTTPTNLQALNGLDANYTVKVADILCVP